MSDMEKIELTFEPFGAAAQAEAEKEAQAAKPVAPEAAEENILTEEEKAMVKAFAAQIDVTNSAQILQFGAGAQQKVAQFSDKALASVRNKDLGEVGGLISNVVMELKGFNAEEEEKGLKGLFRKGTNKVAAMKMKYDKAEKSVDSIVDSLEKHQVTLMKDTAMLDELYARNLTYYKELTMYILAGKQKLAEIRNVIVPEMRAKAEASGLPEDAQAVNDLMAQADRFEKKIHDLELTRTVAMQMAPQIRLVQNNDIVMADKIQSTIVNTIPIWKSQMVIALGLAHSEQAAKAQHEVSELTNQLLKQNADRLKVATISTAKEAERGVVDLETLRHTNEALISTLDEVMAIQSEGRAKRADAELELRKIENELREKLLSIR